MADVTMKPVAVSPAHGPAVRVLFLRTDPGTVEPRILKESTSLSKAGYDVTVFGWDRQQEFGQRETIDGVCFKRSHITAPYGSKMLPFYLPLFWIRVVYEILRQKPGIVHACDLDALVPALLVRPFLRYALVYDIFDHFAEKILGIPSWVRWVIGAVDRKLMALADAVIVTDEHRRTMVAGARTRNLTVIMNVPPPLTVRPAQHPGEVFLLGYAGNIHAHRGLHLILQALDQLEGVRAIFAGWARRPEDRSLLENHPKAEFLGQVPYARSLELMASCDVLLALYDPSLPINAMASSNKIFEAMAVGRPIITNLETSMASIVTEEACGVLVPYGSSRELRVAIGRLRDDPDGRRAMGERGHAAFRLKYNWDLMEARLLGLYSRLTVSFGESCRLKMPT